MWFLLPDEGVAMDDLLADEQTMEFLNSNGNWENSKHLIVNMSVPKFDVVSDFDLGDGLRALGVTDVFDVTVADFSPMTSGSCRDLPFQSRPCGSCGHRRRGCDRGGIYRDDDGRSCSAPEEEMDLYWTVRSVLPSLAMMDCHCSLA